LNELRFEDADFSNWNWEQVHNPREPRGDWSPVVGQSISTQEEAVGIANAILEIEREEYVSFLSDYILRTVQHDPSENIWLFRYGMWQPPNQPIPSRSYFVAIHGDTGEVIQVWYQ